MTVTHFVPKTISTSKEVTDELQSWIDGLPNNCDVSFNRKSFNCEGTLTLEGRSGLRIRDGGIRSKYIEDGHRAHWRAINSRNVRWLNIRVDSVRLPKSEFDAINQWQHAFDLQGVLGANIAACTVTGVLGDGVCCGRSPNGTWTQGVTITATNTFNGTGRQTFAFTAAQNVTVGGCKVQDPTESIIDIEPNGPGWGAKFIAVNNLHISNTNHEHTYSLLYAADYVPGGAVSDITVVNCVQVGNGLVIVVKPAPNNIYENFIITGNKTDTHNTSYALIDQTRVKNLTFKNNDVAISGGT